MYLILLRYTKKFLKYIIKEVKWDRDVAKIAKDSLLCIKIKKISCKTNKFIIT